MAKGKNQKVKLIKILEILKNESDENHPMSTNRLIKRLEDEGVDVERKTLYDDIRCLNECGYEIMVTKTNANNYYVSDRDFDDAELKILLDAVYAARFITEKKTKKLADKIAYLAGSHKAEVLKRRLVPTDSVKHTNERIYYNVDTLNSALDNNKQVSFKYFDYNTSGKRIYRKEGESYLVTPVTLVFSDDNYYLISFTDKYNNLAHYRVDRMDSVEVSELDAISTEKIKGALSEYNRKVFSMFSGKEEIVTLLADNSLVDVIVDKFGEKVVMTDYGDSSFTVNVKVELAPTFYAWCFNFADKLKIIAPQTATAAMKKMLEDTIKAY